MLTFNEYQEEAVKTAIYPDTHKLIYPTLGLAGEAGEVSEKVKKIVRDKNGRVSDEDKAELAKELGDVLWYIANISADIGIDMNLVAAVNMDKLKSRAERGKLQGSGDNR